MSDDAIEGDDDSIIVLTRRVYEDVCQDYVDWAISYETNIAKDLHSPHFSIHVSDPVVDAPIARHLDTLSTASKNAFLRSTCSSGDAPISIVQWDVDSGEPEWLVPMPEPTNQPLIYESVAPGDRSLSIGDDPDSLPFVPFSDSPRFITSSECMDYIGQYKGVQWSLKGPTCDDKIVIAETMRVLVSGYGLSSTALSNVKIHGLSLKAASIYLSQQDLPPWPRSPILRTFLDHFLQAQLQSTLSNSASLISQQSAWFCNHPNCMAVFCLRHITSGTAKPPPVMPLLTKEQVLEQTPSPCVNSCWMNKGPLRTCPSWPEEHFGLLQQLLLYSPDDLPPCSLAGILRKPCAQTYYFWSLCRPSPLLRSPPQQALRIKVDSTKAEQHDLCNHVGPCDETTKCRCFLKGVFCEASCLCSLSCPRRWPGCKCGDNPHSGSKHSCFSPATVNYSRRKQLCPCVSSGRECDPQVCIPCVPRMSEESARRSTHMRCRNVQLFSNEWKATRVKRGQWGLGLFIDEDAQPGDLILEYVGELIFDATWQTRGLLYSHTDRSYVFGLMADLSIDGAAMGNGSRFINHSRDQKNCTPKVLTVCGEARIGLFASRHITKGEEILFDYGRTFFYHKHLQGDPSNSLTVQLPPSVAESRGTTTDNSDEIQTSTLKNKKTKSGKVILSDESDLL